jgi:hypothetical protein
VRVLDGLERQCDKVQAVRLRQRRWKVGNCLRGQVISSGSNSCQRPDVRRCDERLHVEDVAGAVCLDPRVALVDVLSRDGIGCHSSIFVDRERRIVAADISDLRDHLAERSGRRELPFVCRARFLGEDTGQARSLDSRRV